MVWRETLWHSHRASKPVEDPNLDIIFDDNILYNYTDINAKIGSSRLHFGRALADDPRHQEGVLAPGGTPSPSGRPRKLLSTVNRWIQCWSRLDEVEFTNIKDHFPKNHHYIIYNQGSWEQCGEYWLDRQVSVWILFIYVSEWYLPLTSLS